VHPLISGIILTQTNPASNVGDCHSCDMGHNFRYQDFCLASTLLRPYLHYNAFWQATTSSKPDALAPTHFGDLKFVAFFCLTLYGLSHSVRDLLKKIYILINRMI